MAFTKLSAQDKDAFFGLLDEYFQSRPELFGQHGNGGPRVSDLGGVGIPTAAAASAVHRALAAGGGSGTSGVASVLKSNNPYTADTVQDTLGARANSVDAASVVTAGRVAAASLAFAGGGPPLPLPSHSHSPSPSPSLPPSLPRRMASNAPAPPERAQVPGAEIDKLVTKKGSLFSAFKKPETTGVVIPSAFPPPKNTYGPPPARRVTSDQTAGAAGGSGNNNGHNNNNNNGGGVRTLPPRRVAPALGPEPEPEPASEVLEGEWAEVLYDYSSEDPGDLTIETGTKVFVTDKTSDDWWTGQVEGRGKEGLFPASYIKLL